jgi:hypothetical protein
MKDVEKNGDINRVLSAGVTVYYAHGEIIFPERHSEPKQGPLMS